MQLHWVLPNMTAPILYPHLPRPLLQSARHPSTQMSTRQNACLAPTLAQRFDHTLNSAAHLLSGTDALLAASQRLLSTRHLRASCLQLRLKLLPHRLQRRTLWCGVVMAKERARVKTKPGLDIEK